MLSIRYSRLNCSHVQRTLIKNISSPFSTYHCSKKMFELNSARVVGGAGVLRVSGGGANRCALFSTVAKGQQQQMVASEQVAANKGGQQQTVYTIPKKITLFIDEAAKICKPDKIHICDGSDTEYENLINLMVQGNMALPLPKYDNCYLVRTDPRDVARVESKTIISTEVKRDVVPLGSNPHPGQVPNWMSPQELNEKLGERFPGCMKGRTMYVIPFSMGPVGSPLSKIGIQCTDSPYVVVSMRIMTRMGLDVLRILNEETQFVKCLHSVGVPITSSSSPSPLWPCNPEQTLITHKPESNEILSFGSGYGGNSLLGKKCLALRLGSFMARKESWLAEHMLILGITNPQGVKKYVAAAFPSACGKTNLAMMTPKLPGWKVECVGDDIAWMRFDKNGVLRAINPENGFFGVAPGTGENTNPIAMATVFKDTVFTNVGHRDGGVYWEGMDDGDGDNIVDWKGNQFVKGSGVPAAHPNSRFCTPAKNCPIMDPLWESPEGVPISAILFGGRRPEGVPLVYEALNWDHGVYMGASMRSEATAAAEHKGKVIMHDPFAMRPFVGYNMGQYFGHWASFGKNQGLNLPKIFHVNWFRKDEQGKFLWPGFGENVRVLDWIMRRIDEPQNSQIATESPIGILPTQAGFNLEGLDKLNWDKLFDVDKSFWAQEIEHISKYFEDNIGVDLPSEIRDQVNMLKARVQQQQQ